MSVRAGGAANTRLPGSLPRMGWRLWLLLLILIPVSSSPVVAAFSGGETPVSPLSMVPLAAIVLIVIIPFLLRGGRFPALVWPLMAFCMFALLSAANSFFLPLFPFKGQTSIDRVVRALITIGVGVSFYLSAVIVVRDERRLRYSIKAIYIGLIGLLLWSTVQAWLVLDGSERIPLTITRIHHIFSVRDLWGDRVTGMAFEPSWLGDQLVVLYIPLLLSSVSLKRSAFSVRVKKISIEWLLLFWSIFILFLTQSRISFLSMFALLSAAFMYLGVKWNRKLLRNKFKLSGRNLIWVQLIGIMFFLAILVSLLIGAGWVLSRVDDRLAMLFSIPPRIREFAYFYPNEAQFELANSLAFAERVVYWATGWRVFSAYPIVGVGPGNMGFFFERFLPPYGFQLTEMQNVLQLAEFGFPNPKNLWVRLLAEGGLIGFSSYFVWYLLIAIGAFAVWRETRGYIQVIGLASLIGALTFFVEGFSIDTYALPQGWIIFGLLTASISFSGLLEGPDGKYSAAQEGNHLGQSQHSRRAETSAPAEGQMENRE